LWAALYFTTPLLVLYVYQRNRSHDAPVTGADLLLPMTTARIIGAVGVLALATGLFLFFAPATAISLWPWLLTPLTTRVLGAIFCLGLAGIGALSDRRWSSAQVPLQTAFVMVVMILISGARAHAEFDAGNALTWMLLVGFAGTAAAIAILYARMEQRAHA
jgi:hypothetical protein